MGEYPPQGGGARAGFIPQYSSDNEAPNGTLYYNSTDGLKKYKDPSGTVHVDATTPVPNSSLANDSVTVAGNSVALGGSTPVNFTDLGDAGTGEVGNTDLANDSVTVNAGSNLTGGGSVALGSSVTLNATVASNVPDWQEDGNSPLTISSATAGTYTLASAYDVVQVQITSVSGSGSATNLLLRINSDSGSDYQYYDASASHTTGSTSYLLGSLMGTSHAHSVRGGFFMNGKWAVEHSIASSVPGDVGNTPPLTYGNNTSVTSPLSSFTLLTSGSTAFSLTAHVYGLNG